MLENGNKERNKVLKKSSPLIEIERLIASYAVIRSGEGPRMVNHCACGGSGNSMLSRPYIPDSAVMTEYLDSSDGCMDVILSRFSTSPCGRLRALMRDCIALSLPVAVLSTESFCA